MVQTLEQLVQIMPPPELPLASIGDWQVASTLGTELPSDYMAFIARYGTGRISGFLWVCNPFEQNLHLNQLSKYRLILDGDRELRESWPDDVSEPLFPEPNGLLPWAATDNGDRLYWRIKGDPDSWSVVVWESRGPEYASFSDRLTGAIIVPVFPPENWEPVLEQNPSYDA